MTESVRRALEGRPIAGIIRGVNAVERFLAGSRAREVQAAAQALAPDVVMLNPASDDPVIGREAVAAALGAVEEARDTFRHTHLLAETDGGQRPLYGLVFEATIGDARLGGVDLIELDEHDRIARFTVAARPAAALMALGARMPGSPGPLTSGQRSEDPRVVDALRRTAAAWWAMGLVA